MTAFGDIFYVERERQSAVARAERWTAGQTARLNTTPEVILEIVRRGWLPEQIEGVSSKYALEYRPPPLEDVPEWIDVLITKQCRAKGDTAMAVAFNKAKDRAA